MYFKKALFVFSPVSATEYIAMLEKPLPERKEAIQKLGVHHPYLKFEKEDLKQKLHNG